MRELADELDLAGRIVTLDALHAQHETARCLLDDCGADYLVSAIKANQPTMLDDLQAMLFGHAPACETLDKGHGRIDRRRYWIKDLSDSAGTAMPASTDASRRSASNANAIPARPLRPASK